MTEIQLRKQTLLLESDLNRLTLHAECAQLRETASWLGFAKRLRQRAAPWAFILAPIAGLALTLGLRRSPSRGGILSKALALAPSLIQLRRAWATPPNN
jgi:hypothetical protein